MSNRAITWAYEQHPGPMRKGVLLALANYADESNSCWPSQETLASMTDQNVRTVRRGLKELEELGYIVRTERRQSGHRTSDRYTLAVSVAVGIVPKLPATVSGSQADSVSGSEETQADTLSGSQPDSVSIPTGQSVRVYQRDTSVDTSDTQAAPDGAESEPETTKGGDALAQVTMTKRERAAFDAFWLVYPRKTAKAAAGRRFVHVMKFNDPSEIIAGTKAYSDQCKRDKTEERYIPHPATWLNQGRWEDAPAQAPAPPPISPAQRRAAEAEDQRQRMDALR